MDHDFIENWHSQLRKGLLPLFALYILEQKARYGYELVQEIKSVFRIEVAEGTLYPLLRRLESQGLLVSEWREEEKRNKRFYRLSADGKLILKQLSAEWKSINASLEGII